MKWVPNLLTGLRLVLAVALFVALAAAGSALPGVAAASAARQALELGALAAFVIAAITDFFDGWLARKFAATSTWGAILDPIADKVLVCAAVLGLMALGVREVALPGGLILFREFAVSALREVMAGRSLRLPVTLLAKWKTTLQLAALAVELIVPAWPSLGADAALAAHALLWLAAIVTLVTGAQYLLQARKALANA